MTEEAPIATIVDAEVMITDANAPFDDPNADIILRSSDNIDFKVYKLLLSMASDFFRDMFLLPQTLPVTNATARDGLPVIQVSETANILQMLLSMCYPMGAVDQPALDKLKEVDHLLDAAIKYNIDRVEKRVREALVSPQCLLNNEVRVFAIACRHRLVTEAKAAARATLEQPIMEMDGGPELKLLSAEIFFRLLKYHASCVKAVRETVASFSWPADTASGITAGSYVYCNHCSDGQPYYPIQSQTTPLDLSKVLINRLPSKAELERGSQMESNGAIQCGNCFKVAMRGSCISRETLALYYTQLEDAVSSVSNYTLPKALAYIKYCYTGDVRYSPLTFSKSEYVAHCCIAE